MSEQDVRAAMTAAESAEQVRQQQGERAPHAPPPVPDQEDWREPVRVTIVPPEAPEGLAEAPEAF